ncbi:MAG: response regulator [Pseudobdellovibrio sp.]
MKLLICDDEDLIRKSLARAFKGIGYEVVEAANGQQALDYLSHDSVDLIILDLLMPEKNGFDVLTDMQKVIPVIIISAFSGQQQGHFHTESYPQVIGFIKKPFEHIKSVIEEITVVYENYIRKV